MFDSKVPSQNLSISSFYDTDVFNPSSKPITTSGPTRPRAPDGVYKAKFVGHRTSTFRAPRVELIFDIIPSREKPNVLGKFGMFAPVRRLRGPEGFDGDFDAKGPRSKLVKLMRAAKEALGEAREISLRDLLQLEWTVTLHSPTTDMDGNPIPESERYSVIALATPEQRTDW